MQYPAWKYLVIIVVLIVAGLYAAPNLYPDELRCRLRVLQQVLSCLRAY